MPSAITSAQCERRLHHPGLWYCRRMPRKFAFIFWHRHRLPSANTTQPAEPAPHHTYTHTHTPPHTNNSTTLKHTHTHTHTHIHTHAHTHTHPHTHTQAHTKAVAVM